MLTDSDVEYFTVINTLVLLSGKVNHPLVTTSKADDTTSIKICHEHIFSQLPINMQDDLEELCAQ